MVSGLSPCLVCGVLVTPRLSTGLKIRIADWPTLINELIGQNFCLRGGFRGVECSGLQLQETGWIAEFRSA